MIAGLSLPGLDPWCTLPLWMQVSVPVVGRRRRVVVGLAQQDGEILVGVLVRVVADSESLSASTGPDGRAYFELLIGQRYRIQADDGGRRVLDAVLPIPATGDDWAALWAQPKEFD